MKNKMKKAAILLLQSAAIWMFGWLCCVGISKLMELFHLGM